MKILPKWDYHVHSVFSDGKSTIEQDIERAVAIGLEEIGISDHSFAHCLGGIKRGDILISK